MGGHLARARGQGRATTGVVLPFAFFTTPPTAMDTAPAHLAARFETAPQLFSQWSDDAGVKQDALKVLSTRDTERAGWTVSMSAIEVVRTTSEAATALSLNDIRQRGVPSSRLHARVSWMRAGQGTSIVLDIGTGFRLCIEGCSLEVEVLGPAGALREAQARDARPLGSGGIYLDTLLSGQALGVATDPAHPNTLTQSVVVPAGTAGLSLPLPRFAKRLQAYAPAPSTFERLEYRLGELVLAQVAASATGTTGDHLVPQAATHLATGPAVSANRRLTLVWTLEL